jgi:hypothetical protein
LPGLRGRTWFGRCCSTCRKRPPCPWKGRPAAFEVCEEYNICKIRYIQETSTVILVSFLLLLP